MYSSANILSERWWNVSFLPLFEKKQEKSKWRYIPFKDLSSDICFSLTTTHCSINLLPVLQAQDKQHYTAVSPSVHLPLAFSSPYTPYWSIDPGFFQRGVNYHLPRGGISVTQQGSFCFSVWKSEAVSFKWVTELYIKLHTTWNNAVNTIVDVLFLC